MERLEAQEIHCHNCDRYVRFTIDMSLNGNHVLKCPQCGHEHCRVVRDGKITDDRWDSRNSTFRVRRATTSTTSWASSASCYYLTGAWANSTSSTGSW